MLSIFKTDVLKKSSVDFNRMFDLRDRVPNLKLVLWTPFRVFVASEFIQVLKVKEVKCWFLK